MSITAAPLALKDSVTIGARGDRGASMDRGVTRQTGNIWKTYRSRRRRTRQPDLQGQEQCVAPAAARFYDHRIYDPDTN